MYCYYHDSKLKWAEIKLIERIEYEISSYGKMQKYQ